MINLNHWGSGHLDVDFPLIGGAQLRIVEQPGVWMSEKDLDRILADLSAVVAQCLGPVPLRYGVLSGERTRLANAILTVLYAGKKRRPVAFNALSVMTVDLCDRRLQVVHMGLAMISPAFRTRGLSWVLYGPASLLLLLRNRLRPLWLSNVTQIPSVVGQVAECLANVFPTGDPRSRRTDGHLAIARQIMRDHRGVFGVGPEAGFDEERFVITNAYTGGSDPLKKTFEAAPKHRNESFNRLCRDQLDYDRGDDFLQIGQLTLGAAAACLFRSVPKPWPSRPAPGSRPAWTPSPLVRAPRSRIPVRAGHLQP